MATDHGPELVHPHSTLEVVPPSGLEAAKHGWVGQSGGQLPYNQEYSQPERRVLGLSARTFWIIVIILVVILAGAIGGGVGGGLAGRSGADSST